MQLKVKKTKESVILVGKGTEKEKEKVEERFIAPTSDTRNIVTCS